MSTKQEKKVQRRKKKKRVPGLTAAGSDNHHLYELAVQSTDASIEVIDDVYKSNHKQLPVSLREDFCGTGKLCADWVRSRKNRTAVGLDIDGPTLAWGHEHNIAPLAAAKRRVELLERNVLKSTKRTFDVIGAFNFSYCIFRERVVLKKYLAGALRALNPGGVFMLDLYGGPDSQYELEETTEREGFDYMWEQEYFDPINNFTRCHINFKFFDGTKIKRAFTYEWRLWSLPELRDLMMEVGFNRVDAWWDCDDDILRPMESTENLESWVAYIAAWK